MWGKQSCELNFSVPFLDETKQPWYITYELWPCNSIRVHTASVFVLEGSFILVKGWNIAPLNLLSSTPFKQHLSPQTETKTFGSNNVWEENKDGGRWLTGHRRWRKKRPECWQGVKVWNPPPHLFFLEKEEAFKVQRSSNVIFHLSPLSHAGNLKSRGYSSLVTIPFQNVFWNDFLKGPPHPAPYPHQVAQSHLLGFFCIVLLESQRICTAEIGKRFFSSLHIFFPNTFLRCILYCRVAI